MYTHRQDKLRELIVNSTKISIEISEKVTSKLLHEYFALGGLEKIERYKIKTIIRDKVFEVLKENEK